MEIQDKVEDTELKWIRWAFAVSLVVHLTVFLAKLPNLLTSPSTQEKQWVIETEMVYDVSGADDKSAIDQAKLAEEVKVNQKILPQLPKVFDLKDNSPVSEPEANQDQVPSDEQLAAEKRQAEKLLKQEEEKKQQDLRQQEEKRKQEELVKQQEEEKKRKDEAERLLQLRDIKKQAIAALTKKEALRRLIKEKARKNEQFANEDQTTSKELLLQRQKTLDANVENMSQAQISSEYGMILKSWVQRFYALPEIYANTENQQLAVIELILNNKGEIRKLKLTQSSHNSAFDNLALKTMKAASPYPKPPKQLVGVAIRYRFDASKQP